MLALAEGLTHHATRQQWQRFVFEHAVMIPFLEKERTALRGRLELPTPKDIAIRYLEEEKEEKTLLDNKRR